MSALDETLDQVGFASKPGSTKGRMYSSRFYHAELKHAFRHLMVFVLGAYSDYAISDPDMDAYKEGYNQGVADVLAELTSKVAQL
jgi:hypothetical protein